MKVVFHPDFYPSYTHDPAAEIGRMEAIVEAIEGGVDFVTPEAASETDILAVHTRDHLNDVRQEGLYDIAALAAGAAIRTAEISLTEPAFGLIRPPGHHASASSAWGFCYFNNMAVAIEFLKSHQKIESAFVLDFDMHYGDGTVNILGAKPYVTILNPATRDRRAYLREVEQALTACRADLIAVSAGFDNHSRDWGGVLQTEDYEEMARQVKETAGRNNGACFGLLEGGYNHDVLGRNVEAFLSGLST